MGAFNNFEPSFKPLIFWVRWVLLGFVVTCLVYFFKTEKQRNIDVKTRLWRRFLFTNNELFEHLTDSEKSEMFKVYDTTVINAELFKSKNLETKMEASSTIMKKNTKRVTFN